MDDDMDMDKVESNVCVDAARIPLRLSGADLFWEVGEGEGAMALCADGRHVPFIGDVIFSASFQRSVASVEPTNCRSIGRSYVRNTEWMRLYARTTSVPLRQRQLYLSSNSSAASSSVRWARASSCQLIPTLKGARYNDGDIGGQRDHFFAKLSYKVQIALVRSLFTFTSIPHVRPLYLGSGDSVLDSAPLAFLLGPR